MLEELFPYTRKSLGGNNNLQLAMKTDRAFGKTDRAFENLRGIRRNFVTLTVRRA